MTPHIASLLTPLLRRLDPETAHGLALRSLSAGWVGHDRTPNSPRLAVAALGQNFVNPLGLAAGFDKNAEVVAPLMRLGFGCLEVGTVTPRPQAGNPRPRIFRLAEDRAVINRLGFNNGGLDAFVARLAALPRPAAVPLGANIGINKEGAVPTRDYPALVAALAGLVDYVVVNVSSPNTPGLRDLQSEAGLRGILGAINQSVPVRPPILVKLAPDLSDAGLATIVETCADQGAAGLIVSNTTLARPASLRSGMAVQPGGLSGVPLMAPSTAMLALAARLAAGRLVLIGVGGVASGRDVLTKIRAGATLVQLYSAMAYEGPGLIGRIRRELLAAMDEQGFATLADARGVDVG